MSQRDEDLSFLPFFLTEPVYLLPESLPLTEREDAPEAIGPSKELEEADQPVSELEQPESLSLQLPVIEGENRTKVLILFYQPDAENMNEDASRFLAKVLKAVKRDIDDVARCNWALLERQETALPDVYESIQTIDCKKILAFGDLPLAWSLSHFFQKYHITQDASQRSLLQADHLHEIAQNRDLKVKLWESLQRLFE